MPATTTTPYTAGVARPDMALRAGLPRSLALGAIVVLLLLIVRTAWVTEDAYITLRTVDNWVSGHGLRWNTDERVQAYTHPLWMFLLSASYAVTHEAFFTTVALGVVTSAAALYLLVRLSRSTGHALAALTLLGLSRAFVDYATSGLENPLTHLLVALFIGLYVLRESRLIWLAVTFALLALNRMDAVLVLGPAMLHASYAALREEGLAATLKQLAVGLLPLLAWEAFSLFYYGFLVPNTAFAKLNTGIPTAELFTQGLLYLGTSVAWDPAIAATIAIGLVASCVTLRLRTALLALGVVLQLFYVMRVGGDFMAGRFLCLPLFVSACLLARAEWELERGRALAGLVFPLGLLWLHPSADDVWPVTDHTRTGIADERAYYRQVASVMLAARGFELPNGDWVAEGKSLRNARSGLVDVSGNVGFRGFYAGPDVHIVDYHALTDPLLARLPARFTPTWRVGHFARVVPSGYTETLRTGTCKMDDADLCTYFAALRSVTAGPLWSWARLRTIAALNTGAYDGLIDRERYRFPAPFRDTLQHLSAEVPEGAPFNARGMRVMGVDGLDVDLGRPVRATSLSLSLARGDEYVVVFRRGGRTLGTVEASSLGRSRVALTAPPAAVRVGFDHVIIRPLRGDGWYSAGALQLGPEQDGPMALGEP